MSHDRLRLELRSDAAAVLALMLVPLHGTSAAEVACVFGPPHPVVNTTLEVVRQYQLARPVPYTVAERVWLRTGERVLISQSGCTPATVTYAFQLDTDPEGALGRLAVARLERLQEVVPVGVGALAAALGARVSTDPLAVSFELVPGRERVTLSLTQGNSGPELIVAYEISQ